MTGRDYLSLTFKLIGALFLAIAAAVALRSFLFVRGAQQVSGTVTEISTVQNAISARTAQEGTGILHYPVVSFSGDDGELSEFTGRTGRSNPQFTPGDVVPVLIGAHGDPRLNTIMGVWGTSIILAGLGLVFLVVAVLSPRGFGGEDSEAQGEKL